MLRWYGDTVIRRAEKVDCITEKVDFSRYYLVISQILSPFDKGTAIKQGLQCTYPLSFLCVIAGFRSALWDACQSKNAEELTPKYPDFISERVYALSNATRWWYEYGKEAILLKDV